MTVGLTNDPWPDATTTQESRFPSTTLICHATHKRASNSKLKGSEFLENFWFLNIQLSVMIVNGSTLLQFGLHDSLYQIKSDSVFPPHHSRQDQISMLRVDFLPNSVYYYQSSTSSCSTVQGEKRDYHFPNGFLLPFFFFRIFYYSMRIRNNDIHYPRRSQVRKRSTYAVCMQYVWQQNVSIYYSSGNF